MNAKELLSELTERRTRIAAKSQPFRDERIELQARLSSIESEIHVLTAKIVDIEKSDLIMLDKQIGKLHRTLGAKSLSANSLNSAKTRADE